MINNADRERLITTVIGQLEGELLLGGAWLPIGQVTVTNKTGKSQMSTSQKSEKGEKIFGKKADKIIDEKRKQLAQVVEAVARCRKCPLHRQRLNIVAGEGDPDARIFFVGEAPGETEDKQGRPFVGRAGKLLTNIIEAMGLKRQDVFIGNILKCRPPNNRDPQAGEIACCIDFLYRQLEIIEPEVIVALGSHAARTLLNTSTPIGQLRGRIHQYLSHALAEPIKLVATYHPAYLLRNYSKDTRLRVWQDMQMVLKELNLPIPKR